MRKWTKQPPAGTNKIDWTNSITNGLKFFGSFHEGFPYEYVKQEHGIPGSAWRGMDPVESVMAMTINDLDGPSNAVTFPKHDEIYNGISECTIMCFTRNRNSTVASGQRPYGHMGTGNDPFYTRVTADGNLAVVLLTTVSGYTSVATDYTVAGVDIDRWALWGATWGNDTLTARWERRKDSSPTTTSGVMADVDVSADNVPRVGYANVGGTDSWNGWVAFAAFWDRELSDDEWNSMVDNPWQIFKPPLQFALADPLPQTRSLTVPGIGTQKQVRQPPLPAQIDWSNPLTRNLHAVFLPVGNSFIEVIRGLPPTATVGTLTRSNLPAGTGPYGVTAPGIPAVNFGTEANDYYVDFDFDLGFAEGEVHSIAAIYGGVAQTATSGTILCVGDSSAANTWSALECEVSTNEINATYWPGTFHRASGSEAVLEGGSDKQYALVSANYYPVDASRDELEVFVDGISRGSWDTGERVGESAYDRVTIGRTTDTSRSNSIAGYVGLCLIYKGRTLTDSEWKILARNPYQIFERGSLQIPIEYQELTFDSDAEERLFMFPQRAKGPPK